MEDIERKRCEEGGKDNLWIVGFSPTVRRMFRPGWIRLPESFCLKPLLHVLFTYGEGYNTSCHSATFSCQIGAVWINPYSTAFSRAKEGKRDGKGSKLARVLISKGCLCLPKFPTILLWVVLVSRLIHF